MKKHLSSLLPFILLFFALSLKSNVVSYGYTTSDNISFITDKQQSDIDSYFKMTDSSTSTLPQLQDQLPSPSFRHISKRTIHQNLTNITFHKHFSSEVRPTKKHNNKLSFPLSSKEDLIVIVRHLII